MKKVDKKDLLIIVIIFFAMVTYVSLIFNDSVWQDEAYTMNILRKNFVGIVQETAKDVHPPLYYFIAKILTLFFGYSVPVVKIASIIPVILIMIFIWLKAKKLFPKNYFIVSIMFLLLIAFTPAAFTQNIELRMYTWAMFFTTCSGIYAYELYLEPKINKNIIFFISMGLCAAYTHYYAVLTECFIYMFLIVALILKHKAWKEVSTIINTTIILYLPWLPTFINQFIIVRDYWWLDVFNFSTIIDIVKYPFSGKFVYSFLIISSIVVIGGIIYILKNIKDKETWFALFCILSCILMVVTGCTISLLLRPVYLVRYTYVSIGLLFLGISIILSKIKYGKIVKVFFIAMIILNFPFSYKLAYIEEYYNGTEEFKKFAKDKIKEDIAITTESNDIAHTLPYYLPNNELKWTYITDTTKGYIFSERTMEEMKKLIPNSKVEQLFSGNIDGSMKFNVYIVE